jgi:hypothetical protein
MSKFNTCHHCKFLFPDYLLFTCKFTSDKQAIPKANLEVLGDPNLAETYIECIVLHIKQVRRVGHRKDLPRGRRTV